MNLRRIESRDNAYIKLARKVRDGRETEHIFVEGLRLSEEALCSDISIEYCLVRDGFNSNSRASSLLDAIAGKGVNILQAGDQVFATAAATTSSQGVIMIGRRPATDIQTFEQRIVSSHSPLTLLVMLFETNDPSNVGAVCRTTEAAGARGVVIAKNSSDAFSPKGLRSAMGSVFRLPIWSGAGWAEIFDWAMNGGYSIVAASTSGSTRYASLDWTKPKLLVLGSEAHGLPDELLAKTADRISIPMQPPVESLNLGVAAGVILFEASRQMSSKK